MRVLTCARCGSRFAVADDVTHYLCSVLVRVAGGEARQVHLLSGGAVDSDPATRRFQLLEVDE